MSTFTYDPRTGLRRRRGGGQGFQTTGLIPDLDPSGRTDVGTDTGGLSPTGPSYANLLTIPGTQPDFAALLGADPLLTQFRAGLGAESIADDAARDAAIRRALISFGSIPEGQEFAEYGDPETRSLAELNTAEGLSLLARINRERNRGQQNIMDALAARGALRSGATGVALRDLGQEHKQALSSAQGDMLDYIAGIQRAFTDAERARFRDLARAQQEATGRIDPSTGGTPARTARHIGNGIYEDDQGGLWNADGTRYTGLDPRVQQPPPPPLVEPPPIIGGGGPGFLRAL